MIDLSHLSEEEQEMIMTVLKRDAELKKAEEERIKTMLRQLQQAVPEEDKRKFMSGEWFYEAKSQRHQDKIHGSEIIMASMKQRKPSVVEYLTKSWGGRSRSISQKNSDGILTSPKTTESSEQLKERENGEMLEVQQEKLNIGMRSPSKVLKHQEASHGEVNSEVFNTPHNQPPGQKPVPKKRTKINKPQSSVSDSTSSLSIQSISSQGVSNTAGSDQQFPRSLSITDTLNKTDVSTDYEADSSPLVFNIKRKTNNLKQEDAKLEVMTDEHILTPTDEQGDSIAKVLEWFSRSSDSSDRLDIESDVQYMEDDTKIDDIDFERDIDQRAKPRDNVYLIIPRQSEEVPSEVDTIFLEQTDWGNEQSVDESPQNFLKERRRSESASYKEPALTANFVPPEIPEVNISVGGKLSQNENRAENKVKLDNTDIKQDMTQHQPNERTGVEENQRPKIANLRSFWEKENIGPKILIGKSSAPTKNEHCIPSDISRKTTESVEDQQRSEQSLKVTSPGHQKRERVEEDLDLEHVGSANTTYKAEEPIEEGESKPQLIYANQKTDQIRASSPLEKDVTLSHLKSSSPSLDSGSLLAGQNGDSRGTISINSSEADNKYTKELEAKSSTVPKTNQVPFVKQNSQQENMAERIKQLKSFWEKESRTSAAAQNRSTTTARLNQRFTKSEFDLRTIGTEYDDSDDDAEDSTLARGRMSPNFLVHPLQKDKPVVTDGMSTLQFKNLRDFWGGSPTKSGQRSPVLKSGNQRSASPQSQNERAGVKDFVNESQNNKTSLPAKTRVFQSPSKKRIMTRQESGTKTDQSHMVSGSQTTSEATMVPKPQVGQESQSKHGRRNSKGSLNGKANAMRRAASMFSVNTAVEEQSQDLNLQSKKSQGTNLQQVKRPSEASITQSRKTQEASYTLPKTSPEISWKDRDKNTQRRPSRTSEDSDSQPLARSFIPRDYQHYYLGITEDRSMYSPPSVTEQVSGSVVSVYNSDYSSVDVQGSIQFSLNYVHKLREFHIFVVQCQNLAVVDTKRNRSDPYVKSYLIPDPANLGKRKTAVKKKTLNPTYNEILRYRVRMEYLMCQVLNLSAWHNDTFGRNSFLAKNIPGSGEVHIWVKDCKNLPLIRSPTIDPYVKCFVLPDTSKKSRQKTRVLKRTVNPMFNHTMVYDGFRAEDLKEACVELTVWDRDRLANHILGGLRLGMGTGKSYGVQVDWMDSTAEEVALWRRMMESPNEWVEAMLPLRMVTAAKNTWK
ncbi:synaptotagmin 2 [Labeo rohita]|uniref:Synaptotagmin-like protein 1 n=1 Tax=Labeo rohita TaxID=84645 RepID=A0A498LIE9_LABRO|nr:synaptotagmin 2 [Labeo rohita]